MAGVTLKDVTIGFGGSLLLEVANWQIEQGERICLIGRNGTGKSTLLRLELSPDSGMISKSQGLRTALLPQEVPSDLDGTVYDIINNVATFTLVFEGSGRVEEYVGGYDNWLRQRSETGNAIPKPKH
ncbi:MAG: ATP-binding cassette domain-containing protein [Thermodesulfobacteriota bacterium]|nr:ATP-binding cassette domain-containing protein [Thermodesulfobacteriota bacterium]